MMFCGGVNWSLLLLHVVHGMPLWCGLLALYITCVTHHDFYCFVRVCPEANALDFKEFDENVEGQQPDRISQSNLQSIVK